MKDIKINNFKINSREEVTFKVTVKEWDYSKGEIELLKMSEIEWGMLDIEITWLVKWDEDKNKKSKLQQLALIMQTYSDKSNHSIEELTTNLYWKYHVTTRKDMNIEDIEKEIDSYRLGIYEYSN